MKPVVRRRGGTWRVVTGRLDRPASSWQEAMQVALSYRPRIPASRLCVREGCHRPRIEEQTYLCREHQPRLPARRSGQVQRILRQLDRLAVG